jgi:predicted nucleic acid-binding protein
MVDFKKKLAKKKVKSPVDPTALYDTLDRAVDKGPLRPAQGAVLAEWHKNLRGQRDVIVKLHTGQGKTLIGLLMLQSRLNEGKGPALYLCPNRFPAGRAPRARGVVYQELLQGFHGPRDQRAIVARFAALPFLNPDRHDHFEAAQIRNRARRRGVQVGTIDAVLAQLCIRCELRLLTTDADFARISEHEPLERWTP